MCRWFASTESLDKVRVFVVIDRNGPDDLINIKNILPTITTVKKTDNKTPLSKWYQIASVKVKGATSWLAFLILNYRKFPVKIDDFDSISDKEINHIIYRQTDKMISNRALYDLRQNEILSFQNKHNEIIEKNEHNPQIQKTSIAIAATLVVIYPYV
jgi:hypothetical protein